MKTLKYTILLLFITLAGCQNFEEIEQNPNQATTVPPSLVLTGVLNDALEEPWSKEHRWNQYWACNYNYYGTNEYDWTNAELKYSQLKNITKMEEEALSTGAAEVNPYSAIGKFLRAMFYSRMTQQVGDLPLSEALKGLDNTTPKYDTQKEVYLAILNWLDEANSDMATLIAKGTPPPTAPLGDILAGDIFLGNDLVKWQKSVNAFKLRVLISLSNKEADADLKVKTRFAQVLADPVKYPLMESLDDNMQVFYNGTTSLYPQNPGSKGFDKGRYNMAQTYMQALTDRKDPRVFVVSNPANAKIKAGTAFDDFDAYVGASSGESLDDMTFKAGNGEYSFINQLRYYGTFAGPEPAMMLGYAEQNFNLAEGINRGWATGDAESFYVKGITASMEFYGIKDGSAITVTDQEDVVLGAVTASVTDYLNQVEIAYAGNNATGLEQILMQKYLAFFQNSGLEAFYNQRRTGVPAFLSGVGTGNGGVIPRRWLYPSAEQTTNSTNLEEALTRQFGGKDNKNDVLWINK